MKTSITYKLIQYFFKNVYALDIPVEIHNYKQLKVLDVGSGFNPRLIADVMVNNVLVYDGKKTITEKGRFYTTDIEDLPFKNKSFDLAITSHVFEHLKRPDVAFKELNRVAKKVLIITPSSSREARGTDDDHYWFIYGSGGKYIFEAIPSKFRKNEDKRKIYLEKFRDFNNELAIENETVYFQDSLESTADIIKLIGEFDNERFENNYKRFCIEQKSKKTMPKPIKVRIKIYLKSLLRKYILLTRTKLDPSEYLIK